MKKPFPYSIDRRRALCSTHNTRFMFWFRVAQNSNPLLRMFAKLMLHHYKVTYGLDIPYRTQIGPGLFISHGFNITINRAVRIGRNCDINKGATIGATLRGPKKGVPTIGNEVWIGAGAALVGGITIGDDVLIAPNAYVNCDIPSHSVVIGNPCIIRSRDNATEGYISNRI